MVTLSAARRQPAAAAQALLDNGEIYGLRCARGRALHPHCEPGEAPARAAGAVFDLVLEPLPPLLADGFPLERLRLYVLPNDQVLAVDLHPGPRTYQHRFGGPLTALCLQYPRDPENLRILPTDGLEAHITCAYRHLLYEEAYRRGIPWPTEETPHGDKAQPHPIVSSQTRRNARTWERS